MSLSSPFEVVLWYLLWVVAIGMSNSSPLLVSNYDPSKVNDFATLSAPLEVPPSIQRNVESRPATPIHEKYNLMYPGGKMLLVELQKIREHMVHNDFVMLFQDEAPSTFFQAKYNEDYYFLSSKQFEIMLSNPSGIFSICINQIFSDCQSIHKSLRRPLPFCIDPYTKYPLHFNLYVTSFKNRQMIKSALFINATIKFQDQQILNRLWLHQVKFNLLHNHLRLQALQLKNCKQDHNIISIKNPTRNDLQLLIQYRHKKMYMNNQIFDSNVKITINAGKSFRFLIQGRNATMTIYTYCPSQPQKIFPALYLPLYCLEPAVIEHIPIGILTQPNMAFTYPLLVTSHTMHTIHIKQIQLQSSSQTVKLTKLPTHKLTIHQNQKQVQVASFSVYASRNQTFKNTILILIRYTSTNDSLKGQIYRQFSYSQHYFCVVIGNNRFYHVDQLKRGTDLNQSQKVRHFNYSLANFMQIPIRPELINFDHQFFRMHWYRYTGFYLFPNRMKQQILLQYTGPRSIPISPVKYAATIDLNGGMVIPFEIIVYDNTLICTYQGREDRCSKLKIINFGHQKSTSNYQQQFVTFKNLNPYPIKMTFQPFSPPIFDLKLNLAVGKPFPQYPNAVQSNGSSIFGITLRTGHAINITFQVLVKTNLVGDITILIETPYETLTPKLKFHFESGNLTFTENEIVISQFDHIYRGKLTLISSFHEQFSIKQVISNTNMLHFHFDQLQQYERLQEVTVPFTYFPHVSDLNFTQHCCDQQWMKMYYLDDQEMTEMKFNVELITSSQMQAKMNIIVKNQFSSLLQSNSKEIRKKVLKAYKGSNFCFPIVNPYQSPLKYSVALIPHIIINKPNDYFTYFKYVKRQKVDTYFCIKGHGRNLNFITPSSLRQLFRLEDKPTQMIQKDGMFINKNPSDQANLSNNDYLSGFTQTGKEICYKFTSTLFFKLLIQSQVVNDVLQQYPFEVTEKLIERQYSYLMQSHFSNIFDDFYKRIKINLNKYCSISVFPIFRFCHMFPFKNLNPPQLQPQTRKKHNYLDTRVIPVGGQHQQCYMLNSISSEEIYFHMVINNNYSQFDSYDVHLQLQEPRLQVGDISFEMNHNVNHTTFIKHYFPDLYQILNIKQLLLEQGITSRHKIVPLYLTSQDYDESFNMFKGSRYFEINNHGNIDIQFSHYGFQNVQNMPVYHGIQLSQVDMGGMLKIKGKSKGIFKIDFKLDQNFNINMTDKYIHHQLTLYLYKGNDYYIQLHLVMKVADNILSKIKVKEAQKQLKSGNTLAYLFLNFLSFGYICSVILQLKKEQEQKQSRLQLAKEKLKKISQIFQKKPEKNDMIQDKRNRKMHILPPTSIGTKVDAEQNDKFRLCVSVTEEDLTFFKTLKAKQDKSLIISESSENEHPIRLSQDESQRLKTDEEEKSQKSQSGSKSEEIKQQDQNSENIEVSEEEIESEGSEHSLSESILPDGFSVCNQELDIDDNMDFQFGFESEKVKKMQKKNNNQEYKWFQSHNPLKQKSEPFPWMNQNEKKKTKHKHKKEE